MTPPVHPSRGLAWLPTIRGSGQPMRRVLTCSLALIVSAVVVGCGDDADPAVAPSGDAVPFITVAEAESVIEEGRLAVVRTGGDADVGGVDADADIDVQAVVDRARYESQSGDEFDLVVFASETAARRAAPALVDRDDGESGVRAANAITVFPKPVDEVDAYRAVAGAMHRLAAACDAEGGGEPRLRRICFGPGRSPVPPAGEGVDRDEAQPEEKPIVVGGLHYDPLIARRLNPNIAPDEALVSGRTPPAGKIWFGVFLRVCNRSDEVRTASDRLALVDAFGDRVEPVDVLPSANPYAYEPRTLQPDHCIPRKGTVASRGDGALVLFAVSDELLGDPPVALDVEGARVILDV